MSRPPSILVSGAIANKPFNGGESWVRLSWLQGFERLGYPVFFVEQIAPDHCLDANGQVVPFDRSTNLAYFRQVMAAFGYEHRAALICADESATSGPELDDLEAVVEGTDLLVNITGHLRVPRLFDRARRKAYVDIDPGFTQYWHAAGLDSAHLCRHDLFFTIGESIGTPDCEIPTGDIPWQTVRQPVVLDEWPVVAGRLDRFTTIASWRGGYGRVEAGGRTFGLKAHEFRKVVDLPRRVSVTCEIALDIHQGDAGDADRLRAHGWQLVDPRIVAGDPLAFREYVQKSGAELSVAQGIYVETSCGWFSDRTTRYLASGKPVLVQDTGFSRHLPVGDGLVTFRTPDEAADGAARIARDYARHARAARAVAEACFDSSAVLRSLLDRAGIPP